jgi:hypothetical protein
MSGRCKSCDVPLTNRDFYVQMANNQEEDMCLICLGIAFHPERCVTRSYQFEELTESLYQYSVTPKRKMSDDM